MPSLRGIVSVCVRARIVGTGSLPRHEGFVCVPPPATTPSSWCGLSRREVWECLRLYFAVLSFFSSDFSLSRHKIRVHVISFPLFLLIRILFCPYLWYVSSLISPAPPTSFSGEDYSDAIEAAPINVYMPPLRFVDKFSSRMSSETSWGSHDRILNRDDLDDAFECISTSAWLFIARRSYLVLELILGANNVGNKVPHPVVKAHQPTDMLIFLSYLIHRFIPPLLKKERKYQ